MPSLSSDFLEGLKSYDSHLDAKLDPIEDSVFIWSVRQGVKTHEMTVKRKYAESYNELQSRILKMLPECDVWRKFGKDGNKLDDHLNEVAEKAKQKKHKEAKDKRMAWYKDNMGIVENVIENAREGRITKHQALPYKSKSIQSGIEIKKP